MRRFPLVLALLALPAAAQAAQLKACWDPTSLPDPAATVQVFANGTLVGEGPQATFSGAPSCVFVPLPATFPRAADQAITIAAKNALGEVGPQSNAVTFLAPVIPGQLKNVTVSGVAGP